MKRLLLLACLLSAPSWATCLRWSTAQFMGKPLTYCSLYAPTGTTGYVGLDADGNAAIDTTLPQEYTIGAPGAGQKQLPTAAAGNSGQVKTVVDAAACVDPIAGGGTTWCQVRSDGSDWLVFSGGSSSLPTGVAGDGSSGLQVDGAISTGSPGTASKINVVQGTCPAAATTNYDYTLCVETGVLKQVSAAGAKSSIGPLTASDVAALFSGAGDYLKSDGTKGTPTGGTGAMLLVWPIGAAIASSTTSTYALSQTTGQTVVNEARNRSYIPVSGTIQKMYLYVSPAANTQSATGNLVCKIWKNATTDGPTITIAAGATVATVQTDLSTTLAITAGEFIHLHCANAATASSVNINNVTAVIE